MIESIAAPAAAATGLRYALDRAGQAFGPSSLDASTDLDDVFADFMLPAEALDALRLPFEQLGFTFHDGTLNLSTHVPNPPSYTLARRAQLELALIQLPSVLFGPAPTPVTLIIANGIGYAFERGARLHLFAANEDGTTEFLDTAIKSWTRDGVDAKFHPWRRLAELQASPDREAFITRVFELAPAAVTDGAAANGTANRLDKDQFVALITGLTKAFPTYEALELMLRARADKALAEISAPASINFVVLDVIQAAEAQGWLRDLITGARLHNPGSAELQAAARVIPASLGGDAA